MAEKRSLTDDAKRGDIWSINPYDAVLVGHDDGYPADIENDCYDENRLRKLDEDAKIYALADSIEAMGENVEPVVLKKKKDAKGAEYLAVNAGRRRTKACRKVFDRLKAKGIVFKMKVILADRHEESRITFMRARAENGNREDNTPTENARDFATMIRLAGDTLEKISKETLRDARAVFGVDESTLKNWLVLLRLTNKVQRMVDTGALPQNVARELVDLPADKQEEEAISLAKKAQDEAKGANLLAIAKFQKKVRQGEVNPEHEHEGLTRGQLLGIWKLMQDKSDGKDVKLEDDAVKMLEAVIGKRKPEAIKGLQGYLNRLDEQKKERQEKKAQKAKAKDAAAAE